MDVESLINKLKINVSMLERCNKDWTGIMMDSKGKAKATVPMNSNTPVRYC